MLIEVKQQYRQKYTYLFLTSILGGFLFFVIPQMALAASYTVTTNTDEADGSPVCETGVSTDCSLREAIITSNSNPGDDTIIIPSGTYTLNGLTTSGEESAATGDLDLTDTSGTLTITGSGESSTTIDGNDTDRIFDIATSVTASINDLTITNGKLTDDDGAGVESDGALTLNQVSVTSNEIVYNSGFLYQGIGIYCNVGTISMNDVTVSGGAVSGSADRSAGNGIYGGGISLNSNCTATISNSTIMNNEGQVGGAISLFTNNDGDHVLTNTTISNNVGNYGGGVYHGGNAAALFDGVTISSNEAVISGGGVYSVRPMDYNNVTIYGNSAVEDGGGAYAGGNASGNFTLAHTTIAGNTADSDNDGNGDGGGIYVEHATSNVFVTGSIIADNVTLNGNGPDCYEAGNGFNTMTYSLLEDNGDCTPGTASNNVTGSDPAFSADGLANKGGDIETLIITESSPAKDTIPSEACVDTGGDPLTLDARDFTRPENTNCDMGAVERDQTDPVVTVAGSNTTVECGATYTDAGASATDNLGLSSSLSTTNPVDVAVPNVYTVSYSVDDYDGNQGTGSRTVTVQDTIAPSITLNGESSQTINVGDAYTEQGATVSDACDTSVSMSIGGDTVDTATPGTYTVTYSASDDSNNQATQQTRVITVQPIVTEEVSSDVSVRTNGKYLKVVVNDEVVTQKKVGNTKVAKKFRVLKTKKLYPSKSYTTVAYLVARKKSAELFVFRLTADNNLTKKYKKTFSITQRKSPKIKFRTSKKRIIASVGKKGEVIKYNWKLTKQGKLQ